MLKEDNINKLVSNAIRTIEHVSYTEGYNENKKIYKIVENDKVDGVYEGYIASFGSNLVQSGLLPTLVFYQKTKGDGKRILWSKAIYKMLTGNDSNKDNDLIKYVIQQCKKSDEKAPYSYQKMDFDKLDEMEEKISNIAIALKLAVRTFKIT